MEDPPMFSLLMQWMRRNKILPKISDTERQALEAGDVWVEGDIFAGRADFERLLAQSYHQLPADEQAFLDGPCDELMRMVSDYELSRTRRLPPEVFDFIADNGFFALQIPAEYGGRPMSTLGKSCVMAKVAQHSSFISTLIMIPNSLGPAELLLEYGTPGQKQRYLPRLASGELIPCFGLTEPTAGSDAASIQAEALAFRDDDGEIKFRLNFRKRYITLAPIANLISLACRVQDPENLLGKGEDVGITVLLVEKGVPGLQIGDHHDPVGNTFQNGPIVGRDVIVPATDIIGGPEYAGQGWRMLMEALAGGRMVSLPAGGVSCIRKAAAVAGAYSMVRRQFGMPIGVMEGIQNKIARLNAMSYTFEAARVLGCSALDDGTKPPVASAIMKAYATEMGRQASVDVMDIMAGAGIMQGPINVFGRVYTSAPMPITVEGANLMTRDLMIFGQGATRCHPYAYHVVEAVEQDDVPAFRRTLLLWLWQFVSGFVVLLLRGITRGHFTVAVPDVEPATRRYYRRLGWAASRFGFLTNLAMFLIGGKLKARGNLTGRYADAVAWQFLAQSALRRFEAEGRPSEDLPLVQYSCEYALTQVQRAFEGIYENFDGVFGLFLRSFGRFWLVINPLAKFPGDALAAPVAAITQRYDEQFRRLTAGDFLPADGSPGIGRLMQAFALTSAAEPVRAAIRAAQKRRDLPRGSAESVVDEAAAKGIVDAEGREQLLTAQAACLAAIEVDVFTDEEYYGSPDGVQGLTATGDDGR
ncbi:UNVERIFIED_CONTAM: fadE [Trichonephila clavipes]